MSEEPVGFGNLNNKEWSDLKQIKGLRMEEERGLLRREKSIPLGRLKSGCVCGCGWCFSLWEFVRQPLWRTTSPAYQQGRTIKSGSTSIQELKRTKKHWQTTVGIPLCVMCWASVLFPFTSLVCCDHSEEGGSVYCSDVLFQQLVFSFQCSQISVTVADTCSWCCHTVLLIFVTLWLILQNILHKQINASTGEFLFILLFTLSLWMKFFKPSINMSRKETGLFGVSPEGTGVWLTLSWKAVTSGLTGLSSIKHMLKM